MFALNLSAFCLLGLFLPLAFVAIFNPTPFIIGGVCSPLVLFITHLLWIKKAEAKARAQTGKPVERADVLSAKLPGE
jgi:hypothetical protein